MKKRGQLGIAQSTAQELVLAAAFIFFLLVITFQLINPIQVHKQFISRDISVLTEVISASPFLITVNYSNDFVNLSKYNLNWTGSNFLVSYHKSEARPMRHKFVRNLEIFPNNFGLKRAEFLYFLNDRSELKINSDYEELKPKMNCEDHEINSIFLDPGHGDGDGYTYEEDGKIISEEVKVCRLASMIGYLDYEIESSRPMVEGLIRCFGTERRTEPEIRASMKKNDLVLSFHIGDYESENNEIKIFVEENDGFDIANSFACKLLNNFDQKGIIIPVNKVYNELEHFDSFGKTQKPVIVIEFGTLKSQKTRDMITLGLEVISKQIKEVLNE